MCLNPKLANAQCYEDYQVEISAPDDTPSHVIKEEWTKMVDSPSRKKRAGCALVSAVTRWTMLANSRTISVTNARSKYSINTISFDSGA